MSKVVQTAARASRERTCTDSSKSAWLDELPACLLYSAIKSLQAVTVHVRLQQWPCEILCYTAQLHMGTWVPTWRY